MKIELFPVGLWAGRSRCFGGGRAPGLSYWETKSDAYRVRVGGKWWKGRKPLTLSEFFVVFRKSIIAARTHERKKARIEKRKAKNHE